MGNPTQKTSDLNKLISVTLPPTTMLDVLNAFTKPHGQLGWLVEYARGPAELGNGCIRRAAFEGRFVEVGPIACPGIERQRTF